MSFNLRAIANAAITTVNPNKQATVMQNVGNTQAANFKRTPVYTTTDNVQMQVQGVKAKDLIHLQSQNIQGILRSVHLFGYWQGLNRDANGGGDKMIFDDEAGISRTWLVVWVYENYPTWSRVIVAQQLS